MDSKIFCTFTSVEELENTVQNIQTNYAVIFNKLFVLYAEEQNEFLVTYNIESSKAFRFPSNTILVHRRKQTNTLYTINALNALIRSLNGGILDKSYMVRWEDYQNCLLLTKGPDLRKIGTKLYKIYSSSI